MIFASLPKKLYECSYIYYLLVNLDLFCTWVSQNFVVVVTYMLLLLLINCTLDLFSIELHEGSN